MHRQFPLITDLRVDESTMPCPYLPNRQARLIYWLPQRPWSKEEFDQRLHEGQRRHGSLVYEPDCHGCKECISLRLEIEKFQPTKSHRRIWNKGQAALTATIGAPKCDRPRIELLNRHSHWRGWTEEREIPSSQYEFTFVNSAFNSFEISYYQSDQLVGIAICDQGQDGLSAVYTYYDPSVAKLSLGTYSILYQIDYCRQLGIKYLYLGYFVADCRSLNYKAKFSPHQKLIEGQWVDFA